jgi:hypothetical protein
VVIKSYVMQYRNIMIMQKLKKNVTCDTSIAKMQSEIIIIDQNIKISCNLITTDIRGNLR